MLPAILEYIEFAARTLDIESPVYEFGARQADEGADANVRRFFPDHEYVGCDMLAGEGVDRIVNLHDIDLPDSSISTAVCLDTLEHVEFPRRAVSELYRVLKPEGILIISSLMNFPIHNHPADYWRFTPEGFRSLLSGFSIRHIGFCGPGGFPRSIFGVAWKTETEIPKAFLDAYAKWEKRMRIAEAVMASKSHEEQEAIIQAREKN